MPDIPLDRLCGNLISNAASVVTGAPKVATPQLLLYLRKLLKYDFGCNCLKCTHDLTRRPPWSSRDEQMDVIRHQLHFQNLKTVLLSNLVEKFFETFLDRAKQKGFAIFRYPYQMVFQIVDSMMGSLWHYQRIPYRKSLCPPSVDSPYIPDLPVGVLRVIL